MIELLNIDCMEYMATLPDKAFDLMLTDPPYNMTACEWDKPIDLNSLWKEWNRIIKPNGAFVFTASQPFTTDLINSNRNNFKYELIWDKNTTSSPAIAKIQPLRSHENIIVFYRKQPTYNPILRKNTTKCFGKNHSRRSDVSGNMGDKYNKEVGYPRTIIEFMRPNNLTKEAGGLHPTQKPIDLFRYLIKTYSNEGDTVFDGYMGSGTTAIACLEENRNFVGCEIDKDYFDAAVKRFNIHKMQQKLF